MTQSASNSSSTPTVSEEVISEQVLGTCQGHKTGVGRALSQRVHPGTSSFSSHQEGTSVRVDLHVEVYLRRSYKKNLQIYENHRMIQQLLAQLHLNIQFSIITHPETYVPPNHPTPPGPLPQPDASNDDASDTANLGDSQLFHSFIFSFLY